MISYIFVFAILIIGVIIWQFRSKTHFLRLSSQEFPELSMHILISKKERKIDKIHLRIQPKKKIAVEMIKFELISSKRVFEYIENSDIDKSITFPLFIKSSVIFDVNYPYENFKDNLFEKMNSLHSFRFVLYLQNNKVFKSHELKFDKLWKIYRSDSGKYN